MKTLLTKSLATQTLALSIALSLGTPAFAAIFSDTQSHWAAQSISQLSNENIIGGYPDGSFRPEGSINRAEFSTVLVKALGLTPSSSGYSSFNDVPTSFWASPSIEAVKNQGLVSGYPNGSFLPAKQISRAEAMSVLANAAKLPLPDDMAANQILSGFSDQNLIPSWACRSVAAIVQSGLFANDPGANYRIDPLQPASRAEVAAMVSKLREFTNVARQPVQQAQPQAQYQPQPYAPQQTAQQPAYQQPQQPYTGMQNQALQGYVTYVPAETRFFGTISAAISSELNRQGDTINLTLDQPLIGSDGSVVVPVGSQIVGRIAMLEPAGRMGKPATMDINFTEVVTPDGRRFPLVARINTEDGLLRGDTTKGRVLKAAGATAIGAGSGAALGTAMGPLSGGKVGRGAIYGTAVGAGAGAVAAAAQKGKEVVVTTGDKLEIKLTQPLSITR